MATNNKSAGFAPTTSNSERSYFETQRAALLGEIGIVRRIPSSQPHITNTPCSLLNTRSQQSTN